MPNHSADISESQIRQQIPEILDILLICRSTSTAKKTHNIIWANHNYAEYGKGFSATDEIHPEQITGEFEQLIMPRALKNAALKKARTKAIAEVFTPSHIVKIQNDALNENYRKDKLERYLKRICNEIADIISYNLFQMDGLKYIVPYSATPLIGTPLIGTPLIGFTETFISIGSFNNLVEAENCLKYVKSKFARTMLGVLKITQDNTREKWSKVPLQDFTANSDIDWTKSIAEIDQQLYQKYGLDKKEIAFIEEKVRAME